MKAKLLFCYDQHFKLPNRNTGFIFKVNVVNVNMSFLIVITMETLLLMSLASHFTLSRAENLLLDIASPIMRKNIKLFLMCGVKNSCRKVKCI